LIEHRSELDLISEVLLRRETIDREEFLALLAGASEEDVFRAKDDEARRQRAIDEGAKQASDSPLRMPYPSAIPGPPIPEA